MIVDIEQLTDRFKVSYFDKQGEIAMKEISIPKSEKYKWEYATGSRMDGTYRSWDGKPVKKVQAWFLGRYRTEEFFAALGEKHLADIYEFNLPNTWYCDIETEITHEFADPEIAQNKVLSIALVNSRAETFVLATKDLSHDAIERIKQKYREHVKQHLSDDRVPFTFLHFDNESEMLDTLFTNYFRRAPLLTGWNFVNYDWKYLINRCKRLGVDYTTASISGKTKGEECFPLHKVVVDYLDIYKKWDTTVKVKENFKLDTVGKATLGISKVKYNGSLTDLYNSDYENFIFYNVIDTFLVYLIDRKIKTMQTFLSLGNATRIEAMRAFSPIHMTESILLREFYKRKMIVPDIKKNNKGQSFEGAYVKDPIPGLYEALATFDFSSLYPTTMRQWNISPETFKGKGIDIPPEKQWITTASGAIFDNSYDSVMRTVLTHFFTERKKAKKTAMEIEKVVSELKEIKTQKK
jgi:DNA polymerase elongation subunit (family B)